MKYFVSVNGIIVMANVENIEFFDKYAVFSMVSGSRIQVLYGTEETKEMFTDKILRLL